MAIADIAYFTLLPFSSVDLFMPKFSITATSKLKGILQDMGITDAFGDAADFSGMTEELKVKVSNVRIDLFLSLEAPPMVDRPNEFENSRESSSHFESNLQVVHQAVLSVDEKGTEAAAATTIEIMPMSLPDTVMLNRPFMVLIVEDSTKSILFMGKITNPTL